MSRIDAAVARLVRVLRGASVALVAAYFLLVLAQVLFRYMLNAPLFWAEETIRYGLVWSVMLGSALVAHERAHLRLDGLQETGPRALRRAVRLLANALTILFCGLLAYAGWVFVGRTLGQHSASLDLPMWVVYAAVPVGASLELLLTVLASRAPAAAPRASEL